MHIIIVEETFLLVIWSLITSHMPHYMKMSSSLFEGLEHISLLHSTGCTHAGGGENCDREMLPTSTRKRRPSTSSKWDGARRYSLFRSRALRSFGVTSVK